MTGGYLQMEAAREKILTICGLQKMPYREALELQLALRERCAETKGHESFLMLLEHPPVITLGRAGDRSDILASAEELASRGIEVAETSRGGRITFHGPGQLVMYPIVDLSMRGRDLHRYLRDLEGWLMRLCESYGLNAGRVEGRTGVWVGSDKIAAIGIAVRRWVSYHGVALNVATDLSYFDLIVPCGFHDRGVTSMARELGRAPGLDEVAERAAALFCEEFGFSSVRRELCVPAAHRSA